MLTFIVPIRNPKGVSDWSVIERNMALTLASITNQTHPDWRCILVANEGTSLPSLPNGCEVVWIDRPYKPLPPQYPDREAYYNGLREDKGARIWEGLKAAPPGGFIMVADYDDLISRDLARLVAENPDNPSGWVVERGYVYSGGDFVRLRRHFNDVCGTSLIIRDSILRNPAGEAVNEHIRRRVGSHRFIKAELREGGRPLTEIPFPAAMYRVATGQSSVVYSGVWRSVARDLIKQPLHFAGTLGSIKPITRQMRADFFGGAPER